MGVRAASSQAVAGAARGLAGATGWILAVDRHKEMEQPAHADLPKVITFQAIEIVGHDRVFVGLAIGIVGVDADQDRLIPLVTATSSEGVSLKISFRLIRLIKR